MDFLDTNLSEATSSQPAQNTESNNYQFCAECGTRLLAVAKFCDQCGAKVTTATDVLQAGAGGSEPNPQGVPSMADTDLLHMESDQSTNFDPFAQAGIKEMSSPQDGLISFHEEPEAQEETNQEVVQRDPNYVPPNGEFSVLIKPGESGMRISMNSTGEVIVISQPPRREMVLLDNNSGVSAGTVPLVLPDVGHQVLEINGKDITSETVQDVQKNILKPCQEGATPFRITLLASESQEDYSNLFEDDGLTEEEKQSLAELHRTKSVYYEPPDHIDMIYGYVERFRGEHMTTFHLYREADNKFILAASIESQGHGKIVFHNLQDVKYEGRIDQLPQNSRHPAFLGTCVQNLLGTQFILRDYHVTDPFKKQGRGRIHELGLVQYETNVFGRVPNTIHATLPRYDPVSSSQGQKETLRNRLQKLSKRRRDKDKSILETIRGNNEKQYQAVELEEMEDLLTFETKKPSWNEELGAWTLNFNGRVKLASKKNFLLSPEASNEAMEDEFGSDTVCLRFGKVLKDRFSLDFRHPISPVQALFISMTSFASKRAVT